MCPRSQMMSFHPIWPIAVASARAPGQGRRAADAAMAKGQNRAAQQIVVMSDEKPEKTVTNPRSQSCEMSNFNYLRYP